MYLKSTICSVRGLRPHDTYKNKFFKLTASLAVLSFRYVSNKSRMLWLCYNIFPESFQGERKNIYIYRICDHIYENVTREQLV